MLIAEKMLAAQTVLNSFGSCRTSSNTSASKYTQIISLEFDYAGVISGASIQAILLEKSRLVNYTDRRKGEGSFEIFSQIVYGCNEDEAKEWKLHQVEKFPDDDSGSSYFSHQVCIYFGFNIL